MMNISWQQLLAGAFALVLAVAGATFAIVKLATDNYVSVLQLQTVQLDSRVRQLQERLDVVLSTHEGSAGVSAPVPEQAPSDRRPISISFKQPMDAAQVADFIDVEYSVVGDLPGGSHPVLFVKDPLGQYWSWGTSRTGRHIGVQIGVATDKGRQFEVLVLVTNQDVAFGQVSRALPESVVEASITVTRR